MDGNFLMRAFYDSRRLKGKFTLLQSQGCFILFLLEDLLEEGVGSLKSLAPTERTALVSLPETRICVKCQGIPASQGKTSDVAPCPRPRPQPSVCDLTLPESGAASFSASRMRMA